MNEKGDYAIRYIVSSFHQIVRLLYANQIVLLDVDGQGSTK